MEAVEGEMGKARFVGSSASKGEAAAVGPLAFVFMMLVFVTFES